MAVAVALLWVIPAEAGHPSPSSRRVKQLLAQLEHRSEGVRSHAAQRLYYLQDPAANRAILELAQDSDPRRRAIGIWTLSIVRPPGGRALIVKRLADESPLVRRAAAEAAGTCRLGHAASTLRRMTRDQDSSVRAGAIRALARIGPAGLAGLRHVLQRGRPEEQLLVVTALAEQDEPRSQRLLVRAARRGSPPVRLLAATALLRRRHPDGVRQLGLLLLRCRKKGIRLQAARTLATTEAKAARRVLRRARHDPDEQVRQAVVDALAEPPRRNR